MNKISKAQQQRLIIIAIGAVALMGVMWWMLVIPKQDELRRTLADIAKKQDNLNKAADVLKTAAEVGAAYTNKLELLQQREAGMAPERGAYEWIINTINPFIQSRKGVNIVTFSEPAISDLGIFPKFPYRWATFHINAVGYYHDFGKFFADFENAFPYFRIQNLEISGNTGPAAERRSWPLVLTSSRPWWPPPTPNERASHSHPAGAHLGLRGGPAGLGRALALQQSGARARAETARADRCQDQCRRRRGDQQRRPVCLRL